MLPIRVISLERAVTRREQIARQFKTLDIDYEFFDATDGREAGFPAPFPSSEFTGRGARRHSRAATACLVSHYRLWHECIRLQEPILILEDDAVLGDRFAAAARAAAEIVGPNLVRLGGLSKRRPETIGLARDDLEIGLLNKGVAGAHAYVVGPVGSQRLIDRTHPVRDPADDYIERFWDHGVANLAILPWQVTQSPQETSSIDALAPTPRIRRLHHKVPRMADNIRRQVSYLRYRREFALQLGFGVEV